MLGRFPAWIFNSLSAALLVVCGIHSSSAQTLTSSETAASERTAQVASYAEGRLSVWQKRLNLQEWGVSIVVSRAGELKPKTVGNIHWDREKKTAVIRVLDPADYKLPFDQMLQDIEFTIVHELIHLEIAPVFTDLTRTEANRMEEEHAVNHMTDALLKLDRTQAKQSTGTVVATSAQ
jgi:hypothetical protein